jgi:tetraacyldisaccharide 4'-kinase
LKSASAARRLLLPLVPLYRLGLAVSARQASSPRHLKWPVISIGNLSTGGAGKTPLAVALARLLTRRGMHVDVLSRGYGRTSHGTLRVDPDGSADMFGDEPLLIAREADVPVYVSAERYEAGMMAEQAAANAVRGIHLLDDGFQHRRLARAVDILLVNSRDLHDRLLPAGNLREPLNAMRRAQVIAIPADEPQLEAELRERGWSGPVWRLRRSMEIPPLAGAAVAFCGIAQPEQFFGGLAAGGLNVASRIAFRDHHRYVQHDLDCLKDAARSVGASALITTEKDRVRLGALASAIPAPLELHTARLRVEIEDEDAVADWLLERVR